MVEGDGRSSTTSGSSTTRAPTGRRPGPRGAAARTGSASCGSCSSSRRAGTRSTRSTTGVTERENPAIAGRRDLHDGRRTDPARPAHQAGSREEAAPNVKNRSHIITVVARRPNRRRPTACWSRRAAGSAVGRCTSSTAVPAYAYNRYGQDLTMVRATAAPDAGRARGRDGLRATTAAPRRRRARDADASTGREAGRGARRRRRSTSPSTRPSTSASTAAARSPTTTRPCTTRSTAPSRRCASTSRTRSSSGPRCAAG